MEESRDIILLARFDRNPYLAALVALANVAAWALVIYLWRW